MCGFVAKHPFVVGVVLVSGPLAYCVGTALISLLTDGNAGRSIAVPVAFIGLWLAYMGGWVYMFCHINKADQKGGSPVKGRHSNRMREHFSRFDPHSN